jgi:transcriptional regulator with GAF, ATPase, and Fis domain
MATAEDLDTVLQSIVRALVEQAQAVVSRIFLLMYDQECAICRERIAAATQPATDERVLHLVAAAGADGEVGGVFHRVPLDSLLPVAQLVRAREPVLIADWRQESRFERDPRITQLWTELGVVGIAGFPLEFRGELLGSIGYLARRAIDQHEFEMLGIFADQAAMAIKNAYLFRERERYKERLELENAYLQDEIRTDYGFDHIVGASPTLHAVLRKVRQVAAVETTVLLTVRRGRARSSSPAPSTTAARARSGR